MTRSTVVLLSKTYQLRDRDRVDLFDNAAGASNRMEQSRGGYGRIRSGVILGIHFAALGE